MAKSIGMMSGDQMRLQQVVENLLTNAIKFTPAGGRVTVALEQVDASAKLEVSDTGRGISPEFLPRIFDRFTQEDSSNTRPYGGLGLGLAIARHIAELHGGTVSVESSGSGKGAIFTVLLPLIASRRELVDAQVAPASKPGPTVPGPPASDPWKLSGLRVLVIDDDPGTREAVEQVLDWAGADVRGAASAAEGVAAFGQFRPELILCDIAMPGEDGYSFVRKMRALSRDRGDEVPAIALTALAGDDDRQRALDAGFQMHLAKPVEIDVLLEAVVELSKRSASDHALGAGGLPGQARSGRDLDEADAFHASPKLAAVYAVPIAD
jgi:two-component system CheB/CheR fusion protein